jgi:hypothetical protein
MEAFDNNPITQLCCTININLNQSFKIYPKGNLIKVEFKYPTLDEDLLKNLITILGNCVSQYWHGKKITSAGLNIFFNSEFMNITCEQYELSGILAGLYNILFNYSSENIDKFINKLDKLEHYIRKFISTLNFVENLAYTEASQVGLDIYFMIRSSDMKQTLKLLEQDFLTTPLNLPLNFEEILDIEQDNISNQDYLENKKLEAYLEKESNVPADQQPETPYTVEAINEQDYIRERYLDEQLDRFINEQNQREFERRDLERQIREFDSQYNRALQEEEDYFENNPTQAQRNLDELDSLKKDSNEDYNTKEGHGLITRSRILQKRFRKYYQ